MLSRASLVLVLLALVAGGLVGYGLGRGGAPEPPEPQTESPSRIERPDRTVRRPESPRPAGGSSALGDVLASLPASEIERGDGVISGRVDTSAGKPVAGVLVRAVRIGSWGGPRNEGEPAADRPLEDLVRDFVEFHRRERASRVDARTASDGTYRLEGLADANYRLQAFARGYQIWTQSRGQVRPGATVDFSARPIAGLEIRVIGPDGTEPASAQIDAKGPGGTSGAGWSPSQPRVTLNPGRWTLTARAGNGGLVSDGVEVDLVAGEPHEPITLTLVEKPGIRGQVTYADGHPRGSIHVALRRIRKDTDADPSTLKRARTQTWLHDRTFAFPDLAPGTYLLGVLLARDEVAVSTTVEVVDRMVVADLVVPAPDPADYVVVRVLGPDGAPLEKVDFTAKYRSGTGSGSSSASAQRIAEGTWRVFHHREFREAKREGARFFVIARSGKYGEREVEYAPARDRELTVAFVEPATLVVTVAKLEGSGYEDSVSVGVVPAGSRGGGSHITGPSPVRDDAGERTRGTYEFGPLAPGAYEIQLGVRTDDHGTRRVLTVPVTLAAGKSEKTVVLPALYDLTVMVEGSTRISLRSGDDRSRSWRQEPKDGKIVFHGVPAGTYQLETMEGPRSGTMTVNVPGQTLVRFDPKPVNALKVKIADPSGTLARAGFRDGDLIVGVNGEEFRNIRDMQAKILGATGDEPPRLMIQRGATRLEIAVDLMPILRDGGGNAGGRIDPVSR